MNIGVFGCDPGGATGLAWGIFNPYAGGAAEALLTRQLSGSCTVEGTISSQIREIAQIWQNFYSACVRSALLPPDHVWFVMEDFIYTANNTYGGEDSMISTALIWGIEGYRLGTRDEFRKHKRSAVIEMPDVILQTASQAKGYMTKQRLKDSNTWVVGRDHERSAWQHIGYFLKHYIEQHV